MQKADELTARGIDRSRAAALLRIAAEATHSANTCPPAPPTSDSPTSPTDYLSVLLLNLYVTIVALAAFISSYSSTTQTLISAKIPCQEQVLEGQGTTNEESTFSFCN